MWTVVLNVIIEGVEFVWFESVPVLVGYPGIMKRFLFMDFGGS